MAYSAWMETVAGNQGQTAEAQAQAQQTTPASEQTTENQPAAGVDLNNPETNPLFQAAVGMQGAGNQAPASATTAQEAAEPVVTPTTSDAPEQQQQTTVDTVNRNNIGYKDSEARAAAQIALHNRMVKSGNVIDLTDNAEAFSEFYPDLKTQKKSVREKILKEKISELKGILQNYLNSLRGINYAFEINGDIVEARLYNAGIKEVLEKITQNKAGMLGVSDQIFRSAEYLYSTADKTGNPDVSGWDYYYVPVKFGNSTSGVRIAVRNVPNTQGGKIDSQIYNWNIKSPTPVAGDEVSKTPGPVDGSLGVGHLESLAGDGQSKATQSVGSSSASINIIAQPAPAVNQNGSTGFESTGEVPTQTHATDPLYTATERTEPGLTQEDSTHQLRRDVDVDAEAESRIRSDPDGERARLFQADTDWNDADTATAHKVLEAAIDEARKTGDYSEVVRLQRSWEEHMRDPKKAGIPGRRRSWHTVLRLKIDAALPA